MATILVIEDQFPNANLTAFLMEKIGHEVYIAPNAEIGLQLVKTLRPDLILMDIRLPAMDGLEATKILKRDPETSQIPVIALSASKSEDDMRSAYLSGCVGFIKKPFQYRILWDSVEQHLSKVER